MDNYEKRTWNNNGIPAINAENLNHIEDGIGDATDAIQKIIDDLEGEELYINAQSDQRMAETVIIPKNNKRLTDYKRFVVLCKCKTNIDKYTEHHISCKDKTMLIPVYYDYGGYNRDHTYYREITFDTTNNNNKISISKGYCNDGNVDNDYGIVFKIIGYKI